MSALSSALARSSFASVRRSALHSSVVLQARRATSTSTSYPYVPGGPVLKGTVNDPTSFPESSKSHGSYHWAFERLLAASLVPLTAAAVVTTGSQYPMVDALLGLGLVVHSHIGFDSSRVDYLHPRKFPVLGPLVKWGLRGASVGAAYGVYMFNTNDIGLCDLIARVWHA